MLPDPALVVLVGASGSGKSVWAAEHYRPDEVVSSDRLRALVGSGEHDLDASADAFAPHLTDPGDILRLAPLAAVFA